MILVFRTTIRHQLQAGMVAQKLRALENVKCVTVDLEDWENILRIECEDRVRPENIIEIVNAQGFKCSELMD